MTIPRSIHDRLIGLFGRLQALGIGQPRLQHAGLTLPQIALVVSILHTPGIRVNQVADLLGVSTPTVSVAVRKMERDGWLRRKVDPDDKRAARLFLSTKAVALARQVSAQRRKYVSQFMQALTPHEQEQLLSLLDKAITNMEEKRKPSYKEIARPVSR